MPQSASRYSGPDAVAAEGWSVERLTPRSRLFGANGITTGADGRIYCAQVPGSQVSAIDVDTGEIETISPLGGAIVGPDDLVFDEAGNLYCTEITEDRVSVLRLNGTSEVVHGDVRVANPITYHQGRLIAGELRIGGRIMELDRNGGAPRVIVEGVPMANAFQVGPDGMLYFPAQAANEIWRVSLAGGEPEVVARDLGVPDSVKFDSKGRIVSTQVISGQVLRLDLQSGQREVLADLGPGLDNVTFLGERMFVSSIPGEITEILAPGQVRSVIPRALQWPLGLAVGHDGALLVADGMFAYTLRTGGKLEMVGMGFFPGTPGYVRGAATSAPGEWIVTNGNGAVSRWRPAEATNDVIAEGYDQLMGVALAPGGTVVFAEYGTGRVLSAEAGAVSELADELDKPMGVAVAPDGAVYVSEAGAGRIVKLVGGRAETILDGLQRPEGIAFSGGKLFVLDSVAKVLVAADPSGGGRRTVAENLPVGAPQGVTPKFLGSIGDMAGPMVNFAGLAAGADGTLYVAADAEGSVIALRPAQPGA